MSGIKKDLGTIQRAVQILAGTYDKDLLSFEVAQVMTVDTKNWLCSVQLVSGNKQTVYNNVQLTAEKASNGFIQVPKVMSNVILAITFRNEQYVFMCSEIDALVFHQKNSDNTYEEFVICCNASTGLPLGIQMVDGGGNGITISSKGTIEMNGASFGGLVKLIDPNNSDYGILSRLNDIENFLSDFVSKFNNHTHILTLTSGTGTAAITATPEVNPVPSTSRTMLENADITHGPSVS